jgi:diketogulonate reductase-like aldo/keto reductase
VALAWLLAKPVITAPIVGVTKLYHLDEALASVNVKLSGEEIALLEESYLRTRSWASSEAQRPFVSQFGLIGSAHNVSY